MKVKIKNYGSYYEADLNSVLEPRGDYEGGKMELTFAQAEANKEAIGRLLAYMVEHQQGMSLEKACEIAGVYYESIKVGTL